MLRKRGQQPSPPSTEGDVAAALHQEARQASAEPSESHVDPVASTGAVDASAARAEFIDRAAIALYGGGWPIASIWQRAEMLWKSREAYKAGKDRQ